MRIKPWLWISAIVLLMGSAPVFTYDRNQGPDGRSRNGRESDKQYREYEREREKEMREADRERDKEWREYLKYRKRQYKEWSKANRWEQEDFENYRRDRGRRYDGRYEERYEGPYEGQYGNWGRGNPPRNGACFYTDSDYRGDYFCINSNGRQWNVGDRYNDRISSIRVFGGSRVVAYENEGFGGDRRAYYGNVPNLGSFNDEITSIEVR